VDASGNLVSIAERTKIYEESGHIFYEDGEGLKHEVPYHSSVSMNFWCFHQSVFELTSNLFVQFLQAHGTEEKSEFFIPIVADAFIKQDHGTIEVIPTSAQWFGVTYKEDAPGVQASIDALVAGGEYPASLWG
jgi:hypothetical protein